MLRYPEVYTDLVFVSVSTMPLELRCAKKIDSDSIEDSSIEDGSFTTSISSHVRSIKNLSSWRMHTENEKILMDDIKASGMGCDKVTQFSLRPRELKILVHKPGDYFRWFYIEMDKKVTLDQFMEEINDDVEKSSWIEGLQRRVKLREAAIEEFLL